MRVRRRLAIHRRHEPFYGQHLQEDEADQALGNEVRRVEGQRVDEGACACGSVGREEYDAAHDVAEKARIGLGDGAIRLSVGLEDADDICAALAQGLKN